MTTKQINKIVEELARPEYRKGTEGLSNNEAWAKIKENIKTKNEVLFNDIQKLTADELRKKGFMTFMFCLSLLQDKNTSNYSNVEKLSEERYRTLDQMEAIKKAKELSKINNSFWTVIKSYSEDLNSECYYIENGIALINTSEELIGEFENGQAIKNYSHKQERIK